MDNVDWSEATKILLTAITSAVFTGILAFAGQKIIERWLSRNLEQFKTELQLSLFRHQTRFATLHDKRAEVIAELYLRLARAERSLKIAAMLVAQNNTQQFEKLTSALDNTKAFFSYFEEHRLYIPRKLAGRLQQLTQTFVDVNKGLYFSQPNDKTEYDDAWKNFQQAISTLTDEIPKAKEEIEEDFAQLLGELNNPTILPK
jgi:hypothetical protein